MYRLRYIRYILEIVSVPIFFFLVVHLAGHGLLVLMGESHEHDHISMDNPLGFELVDSLWGTLLTIMFVWIWHRKMMKKIVPCSHEHCHDAKPWMHILAMVALGLHFFPESVIRREFMEDLISGQAWSSVALIGFGAHFFVDILVAIVISTYWEKVYQQILSFVLLASAWIASWYVGGHVFEIGSHMGEGVFLLLSAFLLAMFVHKPHRPKHHCHSC